MPSKKKYIQQYSNTLNSNSNMKYSAEDLETINYVLKNYDFQGNFGDYSQDVDKAIENETNEINAISRKRNKKVAEILNEVADLCDKSIEEIKQKADKVDSEIQDKKATLEKVIYSDEHKQEFDKLRAPLLTISNKYDIKTDERTKPNFYEDEDKEEFDKKFFELEDYIEKNQDSINPKSDEQLAEDFCNSPERKELREKLYLKNKAFIDYYFENDEFEDGCPEDIKQCVGNQKEFDKTVQANLNATILNSLKKDSCDYIKAKREYEQHLGKCGLDPKFEWDIHVKKQEYEKLNADIKDLSINGKVRKAKQTEALKNNDVLKSIDEETKLKSTAIDNLNKFQEIGPTLVEITGAMDQKNVDAVKQDFFKAKDEYAKLNGWQQFWADRLPAWMYGKADISNRIAAGKEVLNSIGVKPETLEAEYEKYLGHKEIKSIDDEVNKIEQMDINGKDEVRVKDNDFNMALGDVTNLEKGAQKNDAQKSQYKRYEVQL
ncbi:MAG: hypothetical protein MJ193_00030, partial [Clostridia bacterium]|nr:hypothetical protein [Clostridia bacterium]